MTEVRWEISNPSQELLTCRLDMNGDGQAEYTIESCPVTGSQAHMFEIPGAHVVNLTVEGEDGKVVSSETHVYANHLEWNDRTKFSDEMAGVHEIEVTSNSLVITVDSEGEQPTFEEGQVLVSTQGGGYLRKVVGVHYDGDQIILETEPATLEDAISTGNFGAEDVVAISDVQCMSNCETFVAKRSLDRRHLRDNYTDALEFDVHPPASENMQLHNASLRIGDHLAYSMAMSNSAMSDMTMVWSNYFEFRAHIASTAADSMQLTLPVLHINSAGVGLFPIAFDLSGSLKIVSNGIFEGDISINYEVVTTMVYANGQFTTTQTLASEPEITLSNIDTTADMPLKVLAAPTQTMSIYGLSGPQIDPSVKTLIYNVQPNTSQVEAACTQATANGTSSSSGTLGFTANAFNVSGSGTLEDVRFFDNCIYLQSGPPSAETPAPGTTPAPDPAVTQPDCTAGEIKCEGQQLYQCVNGVWIDSMVCAEDAICDSFEGKCITPECDEGSVQCEGDVLKQCTQNAWQMIDCAAADMICVPGRGACEPKVCEDGVNTCEGTRLVSCQGNVKSYTYCGELPATEEAVYGFLCSDTAHACAPRLCLDNSTRCNNNAIEICLNNAWTVLEGCEAKTQKCTEGESGPECRKLVCQPGETICQDDGKGHILLHSCDADGSQFAAGVPCPDADGKAQICRDNKCVEQICVEDDVRCTQDSLSVEVCHDNAWKKTNCNVLETDDRICLEEPDSATPAPTCYDRICEPDTTKCTGVDNRQVSVCELGIRWSDPTDCADGMICMDKDGVADCRTPECIPASFTPYCQSTPEAWVTCNPETFTRVTNLCAPEEHCEALANGCVLYCGNNIIDTADEVCDGTAAFADTCASVLGRANALGKLACSDTCTFVTTGCYWCGDGMLNEGEECDTTIPEGTVCPDGTSGTPICSTSCTIDYSGCLANCGNAKVDPGEECDTTIPAGTVCPELTGKTLIGGMPLCRTDCTINYDNCKYDEIPLPDCTDGQKHCDGNLLKVCESGSWITTDCTATGMICKGDRCETVATPDCTDGQKHCDGNLLKVCESGSWITTDCTATGMICKGD
ncbi:MAG: hypothetical protein IJM59_10185, partial [Proteobacteria bacterium]|nr:hypothetical protein [Pseudomonadota bacterium]